MQNTGISVFERIFSSQKASSDGHPFLRSPRWGEGTDSVDQEGGRWAFGKMVDVCMTCGDRRGGGGGPPPDGGRRRALGEVQLVP